MGNSDSHASFIDGIKRLHVEDVLEEDDAFWTSLFTAGMSVEDVFEIISPEHVRQLTRKRPKNLQVFLRRIVRAMSEVCKSSEEIATKSSSLPAAVLTMANTAIRLLTRIIPFLLEEPGNEILHDILWRPGGYRPSVDPQTTEDGTGTKTGEEEPSADSDAREGGVPPSSPQKAVEAASEDGKKGFVCGNEILHYIGRFLFLAGYTVTLRETPKYELPTHKVETSYVWKGGVGASAELPPMIPTAAQYKARIEVLRCLLACISGPLFLSAEEYQESAPQWLLRFTGGDVCHTANLFCSLMSTVFTYDPVGWGLPYSGYLGGGSEEETVDIALQVLCVVMDFDPKDEIQRQASGMVVREKSDHEAHEEGRKPKKLRNVYRYMLQNISKDREIDLVFGGIVRMLRTVHQANQTYLPNSFRAVGFYQESLVLLWHLITLNPSFVGRVTEKLDTNQVLLPVLYLLQQAQNSPQLVGLLHTASFVLLVLSSERSFSVRLNEPYASKIPLSIPSFQGCHADVLALTLHKVISESLTRPQNDALVEMLVTVLGNVSPYVKSFALESCLKLLSLIERCSRPAYIFRSAFTHHCMMFLLEMLNNIIQYQFEGNSMLVYSILRQKEVFERLPDLQLPLNRTLGADSEASKIASVAQQLGSGVRVVVLGGACRADTDTEEIVRAFASTLNESADNQEMVLITPDTAGVPEFFATSCSKSSRLVQLHHDGEMLAKLGDVYVTIAGTAEAGEICNAALARGAFVLPMLRPANDSSMDYGLNASSIRQPSYISKDDWEKLQSKAVAAREIGATAAAIVSTFVERRLTHGAQTPTEIQASASPASSSKDVKEEEEVEDVESNWTPTEKWLLDLKNKMPLQALLCLIDYLAPQVEGMCKRNDVTDQDEVLKYLKQTTMVGILPVPHPIVIRTYQASSYTAMWFTSYTWGVIFTRSQRMPLYDWKKIRLVVINQ